MRSLYRTILKPIFDFLVALILLSILFVPAFYFTIRIFLQDFSNPFYIPKRVGKNKKNYNMIKFRSMIVNADSSKVDSTSSNDSRITKLGNFIRRYKIDEIPEEGLGQLLNSIHINLLLGSVWDEHIFLG